jgi:hypothetical protein
MDIFISHSNRDKEIAKCLIGLVRSSLNLPSERIRCTSVEGFLLPSGISIEHRLRKEIHESKNFIALITPNSIQSTWVLFEIGARWATEKPMMPLLACGATSNDLQGPLSAVATLSCDNPAQLHQFVEDLSTTLGVPTDRAPAYQKSIDQIVELSRGTHSLTATETHSKSDEQIIYDSNKIPVGLAFMGFESVIYEEGQPKSKKALGELKLESNNVLSIERNNTEGRFSIRLMSYLYEGIEQEYIPKIYGMRVKRRLKVTCEAIVTGAEHWIHFVFKTNDKRAGKKTWLSTQKERITDDRNWTHIERYFFVQPEFDCYLRIDDRDVTDAPSSIQIRNIVLSECL